MNPASKLRDCAAAVSGFGMWQSGDGYLVRPHADVQVAEAISLAKQTGRRISQRGSGRSYGDANFGRETIVLDFGRMNRILDWDPSSGLIQVEAGATIEAIWRHCLEDGFWPPVVSGTMFPTVGGALAMNIHGKNNFIEGPLGEHVTWIDVMGSTGKVTRLTPEDPAFYGFISGAGLLGVILRAEMRMKPIRSGNVRVLAHSVSSLDHQFELFERYEGDHDYLVSWVDNFARGSKLGRGELHVAWYDDTKNPASLRPDSQDLPDTILGLLPKSVVWRGLKLFNNRTGMRLVNAAKFLACKRLGDHKSVTQGLVQFSFLLDYVPNWRWSYRPGGFIQYQTFVPKEHAKKVFRKQIELQQASGLESFLGVLKRHRPDNFLFSHAVDGYSFAQDFKVTDANWDRVVHLAHRMNDLTLEHGGRFYFAKDSTLRPQDVQKFLGPETLAKFEDLKSKFDPDGLFTHSLAERVGLVGPGAS